MRSYCTLLNSPINLLMRTYLHHPPKLSVSEDLYNYGPHLRTGEKCLQTLRLNPTRRKKRVVPRTYMTHGCYTIFAYSTPVSIRGDLIVPHFIFRPWLPSATRAFQFMTDCQADGSKDFQLSTPFSVFFVDLRLPAKEKKLAKTESAEINHVTIRRHGYSVSHD